ncbi:MAG TPA: hypothetical protein VGO71_05440 [Baekduia sp.]|nr:hypothetical protein [Baekduia sp.]
MIYPHQFGAVWTWSLNTPGLFVWAVEAHSVKLPKSRDHALHTEYESAATWEPTYEPPE